METLDRELDLPEYRELAGELEVLERSKLEKSSTERQEKAAALKEANTQAAKAFRFEGQEELVKFRPGRILHTSELLRKLRKVCSNPRLEDRGVLGMVGLSVSAPSESGETRRYICAVPVGYMPEYSQMRVGEHGEATNEKYRGWRTVLLRLLEAGVTTEEKLLREFGEPTAYGSGPYLQQLKALRQAA